MVLLFFVAPYWYAAAKFAYFEYIWYRDGRPTIAFILFFRMGFSLPCDHGLDLWDLMEELKSPKNNSFHIWMNNTDFWYVKQKGLIIMSTTTVIVVGGASWKTSDASIWTLYAVVQSVRGRIETEAELDSWTSTSGQREDIFSLPGTVTSE